MNSSDNYVRMFGYYPSQNGKGGFVMVLLPICGTEMTMSFWTKDKPVDGTKFVRLANLKAPFKNSEFKAYTCSIVSCMGDNGELLS